MLDWTDLERAVLMALNPAFPDCDAAGRLLDRAAAETNVPEYIDLAFFFDELALCFANSERWDDAIGAMERARQFGWDGAPDARALIAGYQLRAGRADEARRLYAEVKRETPGDIWLYNAAGYEYREVGDYAEALNWLTEGIRLGIRTGDPEEVVAQLSELRRECLAAIGKGPDVLEEEVDEFLSGHWFGPPNGAPNGLHNSRRDGEERPKGNVTNIVAALAWFPKSEFYRAVQLWPDELERWQDSSHEDYCRGFEQTLREFHQHTPIVQVAPVFVDHYLDWCESERCTPSSADSRAAYAMVVARRGKALAWPPGRNDPCWCGSGRKYKKCCARA